MNRAEIDQILSRHEEEKLYEIVADELANNEIRAGLMAKAIAESNGDVNATRSIYIKLRIQALLDEIKVQLYQEKEKERLEEERQRQYSLDKQKRIDFLFKKAAEAEKQGDPIEELTCYDEIVKLDNISSVYMKRGELLRCFEKYHEAIESYQNAMEYGVACREEAYINIGIVYGTYLNNRQEALKCNEAALKINSHSECALHNMGINLYHLGQYQRAIVYFDKLLKLMPNRETTVEFRNKATTQLNIQTKL